MDDISKKYSSKSYKKFSYVWKSLFLHLFRLCQLMHTNVNDSRMDKVKRTHWKIFLRIKPLITLDHSNLKGFSLYSYIKILHSIQVFKNFFDDRKGRDFERNMLNCIFEKSAFDPFLLTISIFKWEMVTMRKIIKRLKVRGMFNYLVYRTI